MKKIITSILAASAVFGFVSCNKSSGKSSEVVVKLGVTGSVYEDLWEPAQKALKEQGINLKIVQFTDYVTPNNALANGEIDLNGFQHRIFFATEIKNKGYDISLVGNTFLTPLNVYSNKIKSIDELKDGDVVAIPNDVTNGGRAIKVLESAGLIKLKEDAGFNPTVNDIVGNPKNIVIKELAANTIPSALNDVTAAAINGNYALDFNIDPKTAIVKDTLEDKEYWNLIAARTADLKDKEKVAVYDKIVKAYQSAATEDVYNNKFSGYYIKTGWGIDELEQYK
ncbi:MetQ/NlpA family ABC transporter substrate-binding protein [Treponema sp.]|uniref:MetQ/NlpA family ABC transporter substrate-binding protein n=1 Tax=Treponema sp. TaxID=166 RepID=UPI00298E0B07|nr:MetQ/NlpA family ABC transporter substrate-binding protein [Treponema sp.]